MTDKEPPLIKGGQGRTTRNISDSACWFGFCSACAFILFTIWLVTKGIG